MDQVPMAVRQLINSMIASLGFTPKNDEAEKIEEFAVAVFELGMKEGQAREDRRD